jgi:hypothetical protein
VERALLLSRGELREARGSQPPRAGAPVLCNIELKTEMEGSRVFVVVYFCVYSFHENYFIHYYSVAVEANVVSLFRVSLTVPNEKNVVFCVTFLLVLNATFRPTCF